MRFVWVLNGKVILKYISFVMLFLFAVGVLYVERNYISVLSTENPAAIYKVNTDKKVVALTFDISWGRQAPEPIIDILEEKNVRNVTFFISGPWARDNPDIVRRIDKLGMEIGSHGWKHVNYSEHKDEFVIEQILTAHETLLEITGKEPNLIRTPNGDFNKRTLKVAAELGYSVIQWDTDSKDWMRPGPDKIVDNVLSKAFPGDIILLHASDSALQTIDALPRIIDGLREMGYEIVSVTQLIENANIKKKIE
ncbi:polysaccharide deacetylase family sporulation protein PdaB [Desulfuribacillus alkaliarsenatis]|uniref:Polysaccharide deacetylase family sporulation protein PdaB n=1 Tax=Desulfuribacillus alkaliarsenatis TaxID=766136 RepID=A0A1E5G473_9FIRM|nr:polysaccharide deacetylase family sporulation protein PdaB [Desulfuribacillus alkaliarsenatis]OEF97897.1 polysaccharide deacetylase family sporulation protein PdaB [Desulfuribacillus alkaliarsenatis]